MYVCMCTKMSHLLDHNSYHRCQLTWEHQGGSWDSRASSWNGELLPAWTHTWNLYTKESRYWGVNTCVCGCSLSPNMLWGLWGSSPALLWLQFWLWHYLLFWRGGGREGAGYAPQWWCMCLGIFTCAQSLGCCPFGFQLDSRKGLLVRTIQVL